MVQPTQTNHPFAIGLAVLRASPIPQARFTQAIHSSMSQLDTVPRSSWGARYRGGWSPWAAGAWDQVGWITMRSASPG